MKCFRKNKSLFFLIFFIFFIFSIKLFLLHPTASDETTYINMAKEVLKGKLPYKDFFFAHPPFQLFWLAFIFKIFGLNFFTAKFFCLVISFSSLFLLYLIGEELFDNKIAFLSTIFLLFWPGFLIFSGHEYGMWEIFFLLLLSVYFILKNREGVAGFLFSLGIFFRYLIILYIPFLLIFSKLMKKNIKRFFFHLFFSTMTIFFIIYLIFGFNFFDNSILFQISTKLFEDKMPKLVFQYLDLGYFSLFFALLSAVFAYWKKNKILLLLSLYPIAIDLLVLAFLKTVIYHYFLLSLPFVMLATSKTFLESKENSIKVLILLIFSLSAYHNLASFEFYFNSKNSAYMLEIAEFVKKETSLDDSIFGEPVVMNYVSFVTGRRISAFLLDSYPRHLSYEGEQIVLEKIRQDQPKVFIDMNNLYFFLPSLKNYFSENYKPTKSFLGIFNYTIYMKK